MGLIQLRVKVKLISEDDLEWDEEAMGKVNRNRDREWVWRRKAFDANRLYEITEFTNNKCIVEDRYGKLMLVAEPFTDVFKKWMDNKEDDLDLGEELTSEELEEHSQDEDED